MFLRVAYTVQQSRSLTVGLVQRRPQLVLQLQQHPERPLAGQPEARRQRQRVAAGPRRAGARQRIDKIGGDLDLGCVVLRGRSVRRTSAPKAGVAGSMVGRGSSKAAGRRTLNSRYVGGPLGVRSHRNRLLDGNLKLLTAGEARTTGLNVPAASLAGGADTSSAEADLNPFKLDCVDEAGKNADGCIQGTAGSARTPAWGPGGVVREDPPSGRRPPVQAKSYAAPCE